MIISPTNISFLSLSEVIPEASCEECAKIINRDIEGPILGGEWKVFRDKHQFPSRNKNRRNTTIEMPTREGRPISIPSSQHSAPLPIYNFPQARILSGDAVKENDFILTVLGGGDDEISMHKDFPQWDRSHTIKAMPDRFARMIGKVGYSYAVAELGLRMFVPLVPPYIMGKCEDIKLLVGSTPTPFGIASGTIRLETTFVVEMKCVQFGYSVSGLIIVYVQPLAPLALPCYHVVAGLVDFNNPIAQGEIDNWKSEGRLLTRNRGG